MEGSSFHRTPTEANGICGDRAMSIMILCICIAGRVLDGNASARLAQVTSELKAKDENVSSVSCSYDQLTTPSAYLIGLHAKKSNRSESEIVKQFGSTQSIRFDETRQGFFRSEIDWTDGAGNKGARSVYSSDGRDSWQLTHVRAKDGKETLPQVTINADTRSRYTGEIYFRRYLGVTVLPSEDQSADVSPSLIGRITKNRAELMPDETVDGSRCIVMSWTFDANKARLRETIWLRPDKDLVLVRCGREMMQSDSNSWALMEEWRAKEIASTQITVSSGARRFWYPLKIEHKIYDRKGNLYFTKTIGVTSLVLNQAMSSAIFRPKIEDGSTVLDAKKGTTFIYGNKLSPRLRAIVQRNVLESREKLGGHAVSEQQRGAVSPPRGYDGALSWIAMAVGLLGLVVSGCVAARRRR